ncbi:ArsR/SmtB family transcription factor [Shewanella colwelliana]|uniref:ArsR/SmtB family transcription factor n=1 Tax=Shewanella colwelliana TaxID=23 RepID=UPI00048D2E22|nr:metalloregulator ArsR/SmtB family transcription factor [Shewanella colwelliana]
MELEFAAKALKELGHPTRLMIFKHLVKHRYQGLPVGEIQEALSIPGSTLSHHISSLVAAGLVTQRRDGRTLFCVPQFETLQGVIDFLQDECCTQ